MQISKSVLTIIIAVVCLLSYFNTFFASFVWDDTIFIVHNPYMKSFKFLPKYFTQDFWKIGPQTTDSGYYRPLLSASCILDYSIWRNNAFGYHLTNLIFHILVSILVFIFIEMLTHDRRISFFASLIFSAHPIHTEAVSFISGRVDLIPFAFLLCSLILFLKYASNGKRLFYYLSSLFCFFASLLTKEMAVTLPAVVLALDYLFLSGCSIKKVFKNFFRFHLGFFTVLGLYLIMRFYFIGSPLVGAKPLYANFLPGTNPYWRIFTVIKILIYYIRLLVFPYGLNADYFFPAANSLFEPIVALGVIVLFLLAFIVIKYIKRLPVLSFSIIWFFITVLPVSNIFPEGNIFAERYMYIPSLGFCVAAGFFFSWLLNKQVKTQYLNWKVSIYLVFFLLVIALGRVTFERNKVWNNEFILWYETANAPPGKTPRAHLNLASAYISLNFLNEAIKEIKIALELYPGYYEAYDMLGRIYLRKGFIDEAIKMYKIAVELHPEWPTVYSSLAVAYGKKGQYKESIEAALTAINKNPYLDNTRYNLALSYYNAGLFDEAISAYKNYFKVNPYFPRAYVDLGQLYYKKGDYQNAKLYWLKALEISKNYKPAKEALELLKK